MSTSPGCRRSRTSVGSSANTPPPGAATAAPRSRSGGVRISDRTKSDSVAARRMRDRQPTTEACHRAGARSARHRRLRARDQAGRGEPLRARRGLRRTTAASSTGTRTPAPGGCPNTRTRCACCRWARSRPSSRPGGTRCPPTRPSSRPSGTSPGPPPRRGTATPLLQRVLPRTPERAGQADAQSRRARHAHPDRQLPARGPRPGGERAGTDRARPPGGRPPGRGLLWGRQ